MKFVRKLFAILLVLIVILVLPVSLILKNAEQVFFSPDKVSSLVDEHFLTSEVLRNVIQPMVASGLPSEDETFGNEIGGLLDPLSDEGWDKAVDALGISTWASTTTHSVLSDLFAWLDSDSTSPEIMVDMQPLKNNANANTQDIVDIVLAAQEDCSSEEMERLEPVEPSGEISLSDLYSSLTTIYELKIINPNQYLEYTLDNIYIAELGDVKLASNLSKPSCSGIIGATLAPASEIICKFEDDTEYQPDYLQSTLTLTTSRTGSTTLPLCDASANGNNILTQKLSPMFTNAITSSMGAYPDEIDLASFTNLPMDQLASVKKYTEQGHLAAKYGWMAALALLLIAALIGSDKFKGFFSWLGVPLLLAGGILLGANFAPKDMLWEFIAPMIGQGLPEYLNAPVKSFYNSLLAMVSAPMMMQSFIILGAGLLALVLAFVFRKKKTEEVNEEKTEE